MKTSQFICFSPSKRLLLNSKVQSSLKLPNYLKSSKGPGFIFRDKASITDTKLGSDMVNCNNITIENLHMYGPASLIDILQKLKKMTNKHSLALR